LFEKYRNIVTYQNKEPGRVSGRTMKGAKTMEILIPLGLLAAWIILQVWVLPRFGVKT
jgi:hypothetical protein